MTTMRIAAAVTAAALAGPAAAGTVTVDFENTVNAYSDNQLLPNGVELFDVNGAPSGVTLTTGGPNTMSIEASGDVDTTPGFVTDTLGTNDTEVAGATSSLGDFFLRTTEALSADLDGLSPVFSLHFAFGALSVSGEIWDIDGTSPSNTEQWTVSAYDAGGTQLDSILSPLGDSNGASSLDGREWAFGFSGLGPIARIDFDFEGSKQQGIGVAFDNLTFEPAPVPVPASALLLLGGLGGLAVARRRRKAA